MYIPMIRHSNYALELKVSKNALKLMQLYSRGNINFITIIRICSALSGLPF
jgi:DNA-binding Xre family transcriptional regulator